MDELTMVGQLLAEPPPPLGPVTERARQRLDTRLRGQVLPLRRRRVGPVLVACAAGGVAAAITITALVSVGTHPGAPESALTGKPARAFLLAMSAKAGHGLASGRFWCDNETQGTRGMIGAGDKEIAPPWFAGKTRYPASAPPGYKYAIFGRTTGVNCLELPHGTWQGGTAAASSQSLGARPASPADMAAWRRDGSPDHWKSWAGGTVSTAPGKVMWGGPKSADKSDGWGVSLPASPAKLRKLLLKDINRPADRSVNVFGYTLGGGSDPDSQLFSVATSLMSDPISPAVRAAVYHVLSGIKDVQMRPGVTDPEGQTGTAVWLGDPGQLPGAYQLIDPMTGRLMADITVATKPVYGAPAGTVLSYSAWTSAYWTNHLPIPASQLTPALRRVERQH